MTDESDSWRTPLENAIRFQQMASEVSIEALRKTIILPSRIEDAASVEVGQTDSEVVYRENKLELLHYKPLTDNQHSIPILIVYALINRPYIMDLQSNRSIVRRLLRAGHDVYLIDWHEPSRLDRHLGLGDYVNRYIDNCVDEVRDRSDQDAINLLGYCMGGTMSVIYTALNPEKVSALGLMATGLYFEETGGVLELWSDEDYFDPRKMTETFGNVPGEFLAGGFDVLDPVANNVTKYVHLYDRLENEDFVRNFARMEHWLDDDVDVAGDVFAEFIEEIYQDNALYENELTIDGEHVDVTNIDVPLLQVLGKYDTLVPPSASKPFNDVVSSREVTTIEYPTGHVGLSMSSGSQRDVWPEVAEWFLEQSGQPTFADVIGQAIENVFEVDVDTDVTVGDVDELEIGIVDEHGEIARAVLERDTIAIQHFFEEAFDIEIGLIVGPADIVVLIETEDGVTSTVLEDVGDAIRQEVEDALENADLAASYELEDLDGIGPTYAERLRRADIDTVAQLAVADVALVSDRAEISKKMASNWIEQARQFADRTQPSSDD